MAIDICRNDGRDGVFIPLETALKRLKFEAPDSELDSIRSSTLKAPRKFDGAGGLCSAFYSCSSSTHFRTWGA